MTAKPRSRLLTAPPILLRVGRVHLILQTRGNLGFSSVAAVEATRSITPISHTLAGSCWKDGGHIAWLDGALARISFAHLVLVCQGEGLQQFEDVI